MTTPANKALLDTLNASLDDLEDILTPLTHTRTVHDTATSLPVADKARLYVLTTYALESLLFSYLRIQGVDVKEHGIRQELSRVRNYVQKIKEAQEGPEKRDIALDKGAAGRFIKAGLAGNEKYDEERAAQQALERGNAAKKLEELEGKIAERKKEAGKVMEEVEGEGKRKKRKSEGGDQREETAEEKAERKKAKRERKETRKARKQ